MTKRKRLIFTLITLAMGIVITLGLSELLLRMAGFTFYQYPTRVQFGYPDPVTLEQRYVIDHDLFWVPKDYDYQAKIHAWRGQRPSVVFMGCSCTQFSSYDTCFEALLRQRHPDNHFRFVNVGVGGWTSY